MPNFADMIDQGLLGQLTKAFTEPVNSAQHDVVDSFNNGLHNAVAQPLRNIGEALGFGGGR